MKLFKYLNEEITFDYKFLDNLKKDCSDYLKIWKTLDNQNLYRGISNIKDDFVVLTPIKDRLPKDTPIDIHKILDNRIL